ncbi:DUF485 domain-containing protein [Serinibacter salmoneus]|uniref:Uncharacterized membrane protein (DUF485 family) n=1 Tax=Serinibacter salmoneus TaxID=556530 RepID=A0A2A9D2W9_9MICO|nr:DUF485 domain-containing protein [Serinibacter salmoneus]PFG20200.1 uncharacterized membrane protein (DUF485 family) [Serinibacter salmoneus]
MSGIDYPSVQQSPPFTELRSKLRRFVFPMTAFAFGWFLLYVLLASYAPGFMAQPLVGNVNVGIVFGLSQFVTTFGITALYVVYANRELDPRASALREELAEMDGAAHEGAADAPNPAEDAR